jgi:hypothetical protein
VGLQQGLVRAHVTLARLPLPRLRCHRASPARLQAKAAELVDTGLMVGGAPNGGTNGLPAANMLTADQDQDLVF